MTDIKSFFTASKLSDDTNDKLEKMNVEPDKRDAGPAAKGKRWSDEEETRLLLEIKSDVPIADIARTHDRTYGGITSRLREIACKMLSNGRDMKYVIEDTRLTENQINEALERKQRSATKTQTKKKEDMPSANDIASIGTDKLDAFLQSTAQPTAGSKPTKLRDNMNAKSFRHTLNHKLSVEQRCALQQFEDGDNLFITGEGGTGKTLLIRHLVQSAIQHYRKVQVCALTGCAALLLECNARTIHSWSGIKLAKGTVEEIVESVIYNHAARNAWRTTDVLIVDEVSMMSARMFDILNTVGKRVRKSSQPFGGLQLIFVGDFFQLPPVAKKDGIEEGDDKFCFESENWIETFSMDNHIVLNTMFRQDDLVMRRVLGNIRKGNVTDEDVDVLKQHVKRSYDKEAHGGVVPTQLLPTKAKVDRINNDMFYELEGDIVSYSFERKTDCTSYLDGSDKVISAPLLTKCRKSLTPQKASFELDNLINNTPCVKNLELKKGANVMCTVNLNLDRGICNGSIGTVVGFKTDDEKETDEPAPIVLFSNGCRMVMPKKYWQSEDFPILAIGQYPLCLAWAITIHKIQGATLSMAEIDIGSSIFECGQTYVALSRVKSLDGLYLSSFDPKKIKVNQKVKEFYRSIPDVEYEDEDEYNITNE
jgi:ATP-dependent DNA helicase PIF1